MRLSMPAAALSVCLMPFSLTMSAASFDVTRLASATPAPPTPLPASDADAAARHAKRTACLKEARAKKLVGADRTTFVKNCLANH